jgi:hypothetical protein
VCGGDALNLFHPQELELLLCGAPDLDFHALEKVTQYEVGREGGREGGRRAGAAERWYFFQYSTTRGIGCQLFVD